MAEYDFESDEVVEKRGTPVTDFGALGQKIAAIHTDLHSIRQEILPEMKAELKKATEGVIRLEERFDAQNRRINDLERGATDDHSCTKREEIATLKISSDSLLSWRKTIVVLVLGSILGLATLTGSMLWKAATVSSEVNFNKQQIKVLRTSQERMQRELLIESRALAKGSKR